MILKENVTYIFGRFKDDKWGLLSESWGELMWDDDVYSADIYTLSNISMAAIDSINNSLKEGYQIEFVDTIDGRDVDVKINYPEKIMIPFNFLFKKFVENKKFNKELREFIDEL